LAGASLEDALRRLCDARGIKYDPQRTSISKLQAALFQPSKQIEVISSSENKQITVWGDTRNKADHGRFGDITHTEVVAMVLGVRAFIAHLPSPFCRKVNNFRGLFAFLRPYVATIKFAYTKKYLDNIL